MRDFLKKKQKGPCCRYEKELAHGTFVLIAFSWLEFFITTVNAYKIRNAYFKALICLILRLDLI